MTNVFAVVGQHRAEPGRLLLLGEDGRYYAYSADGRPTEVDPTGAWVLDEDGRPAGDEASEAAEPMPGPAASGLRGRSRGGRRFRLAEPAAVRLRGRPFLAFAFGLVLLLGAMVAVPTALAYAPGLATAMTDVDLHAEPVLDAPVLSVVPAGATLELTGEAAGDFVQVSVDGQQGWADVARLDAGGLETATVTTDASLRAEPNSDADVLGVAPAGSTVLLTGAAVDGYLAASFDGTSGWVDASSLS